MKIHVVLSTNFKDTLEEMKEKYETDISSISLCNNEIILKNGDKIKIVMYEYHLRGIEIDSYFFSRNYEDPLIRMAKSRMKT